MLPIILDKSTFQSLSYKDHIQLNKYYMHNVTPLLVSEILGDLSKSEKEGQKLPKEQLINLARKVVPSNTFVNAHYSAMVEKSLLGTLIDIDNRPFLEVTGVINKGGLKGQIIDETEQEVAIRRWTEGGFQEIDEINSAYWRATSTSETVIDDFKNKLSYFSKVALQHKNGEVFKNLIQIKESLYFELEKSESQLYILRLIIEHFNIKDRIAADVIYRWAQNNQPLIKDFAPYAYYCFKIAALYYVAITNKLFGEKRTNLLDLQYLFYLPCTRVFSTNDRFLINLFNLVQTENVTFVSQNDLKNDLAKFQNFDDGGNEVSEIPPVKDSVTYKIWSEVFDVEKIQNDYVTPEDYEQARKKAEQIFRLYDSGVQNDFQDDFNEDPDFIIKNSHVSILEPCRCGSGKSIKDCFLKGLCNSAT